VRGPLAAVLAAGLIALAGCGNGDDKGAADTTPTVTTNTTSVPPAASTLPSRTAPTQTAPPTTPYQTAPQAPGEGNGNGGMAAPPKGNGGTPAP
jgi:hypothetical protein